MKWPSSLTLVRHAESEYNALKEKKKQIPEWAEFSKQFNRGYGKKNFADRVLDGEWPSPELVTLARAVRKKVRAMFGPYSDFDTPLSERGKWQSSETGKQLLAMELETPDIVYVSPYLRTRQTFEGIMGEWPALKDTKVVEEERIREQEHGMTSLHGDWRIFSVLNPEQAAVQKTSGSYYWRHPQGESVCDVRERGRDFLSMLIREQSEKNVWAITHHLTILSTRANLERWGQKEFIDADENSKPVNCGVTMYEGIRGEGKDGRLLLKEYNRKHYPDVSKP